MLIESVKSYLMIFNISFIDVTTMHEKIIYLALLRCPNYKAKVILHFFMPSPWTVAHINKILH